VIRKASKRHPNILAEFRRSAQRLETRRGDEDVDVVRPTSRLASI
jgi:hypothetical protein